MDKVIINSNGTKKTLETVRFLETELKNKGFQIVDQGADLVFSVGGDGTMLRSIRKYLHLGASFVGINTGTLGFLPAISLNEKEISEFLENIKTGNYESKTRSLLSVKVKFKDETIESNFAFNEIIIKSKTTKLINLDIFVDDEFLNEYSGDSLVVSTPLGTTGYAIWTGAAVIDPIINAMQLCPVNPCNSSMRQPLLHPIIFHGERKIILKLKKDYDANEVAIFDGNTQSRKSIDTIEISLIKNGVSLLEPKGYKYWRLLRNKIIEKNKD